MTKKFLLNAVLRDTTKKSDSKGLVKVNLYGPGRENQNLSIKSMSLDRAYTAAGESSLIDLVIEKNEPIKVIIKDVQRDVLKNHIIHMDLYQVDMNKKMTTEIPLHFFGESKAVKELGGILIKSIEYLEVECLPGDLIDKIDVDISVIEDFSHHIKLKDLNIPATIKPQRNLENVIASVAEPKAVVEEVPEVKEATDDKKGETKEKSEQKTGDKK